MIGDTDTGTGTSGDLRYVITKTDETTGDNTIKGQASVTATANANGGQRTVSASTAGAAVPTSFLPINQTTLVVNTLTDDPSGPTPGYTTLRDVITQADFDTANPYVITFSVKGTIDLTSPLPDLNNNIALEGPGASDLTVQRDSGAGQFSVFTVDSGAIVTISGMTIAGGNAGSTYAGGGIDNGGTLTVNNSIFNGNSAYDGGGGIDNGGTLTVNNSTFNQ